MITNDWDDITEEVREALHASGKTVRVICEGSGLSPTTINRIKVHGIPLTPPNMVVLANYFGLNLQFDIVNAKGGRKK